MPTIFDVAREAGVSTAAVSLVLNHPETRRVGAAKRRVILEVAERLGYTPNALARGLAQRRTRILGLVVPMRDPIFFNHFIAQVLSGIQSCLMERGYHLMIYSHAARTGRLTHTQALETRLTDGLIYFNTRLCSEADIAGTIEELQSSGTRFVMVNAYYGHAPIHYVGVDDRQIGHMAGAYLRSRGHERIALLCASRRASIVAPLKEGFEAALREGGVRLNPRWTAYGEYETAAIRAILRRWMKQPQPPTAIFCADDQMAPDVYYALRIEGRSVPRDVAVLGRGDLAFSTYLRPRLSTIRIPTFEMGRRAAELLVDSLAGNLSPQRILLPTELVERGSV